jgi:hypothetical protein
MRTEITKEEIEEGLKIFREYFYERLNQKGYGSFVSPHEWSGHVTEEYLEYQERVHKKDIIGMRDESLFGFICLKNKKMECKKRN